MTPEELVAWMDKAQSTSGPSYRFAEAVTAIRELIAERDSMAKALSEPVLMSEWQLMVAERDRLREQNERLRRIKTHRGCACKFDDDDEPISRCLHHAEIENERDRLREALKRLVDLKDGPRDAVYVCTKAAAWQEARAALEQP